MFENFDVLDSRFAYPVIALLGSQTNIVFKLKFVNSVRIFSWRFNNNADRLRVIRISIGSRA